MSALLVDAPSLPAYGFGSEHPFARDRQLPLFDLMRRTGLYTDDDLLHPAPATRAELETVHRADYIDLLIALADPNDSDAIERAPAFGMGTADNPIVGGLHESAAAAAGGTIACMRAVLDGDARAAFNPAGGLHHAMPAAASGFCIYNDLALAIHEAKRRGVERIVYVDFDVHHGDGVERIFATDPNVLTISFHETPEVRWPFTGYVQEQGSGPGRGSAINVPFAPHTGDASWQAIVESVLRRALARFRPELIVTQHGCDPHYSDPLATMELTTGSFRFAATLSHELAGEHCGGRWVATGGGGYRPYAVIPRAWSMVWAAVSGRELPASVDEGWREHWTRRARERLPERYLDDPRESPHEDEASSADERMLREVERVHRL